MSGVYIYSHLILNEQQKQQLRSLPVSKLTIRKWKSQNDAAPFLTEHNINTISENKTKESWITRYSYKAKGIRLLQCCHGSDMNSLSKNGKTKIRKSRQVHRFMGCLAFVRIKYFKDNSIHIYGYLNHSENCYNRKKIDQFEEQINSWKNSNDKLLSWDSDEFRH
ncbi:hypothetical protein RclHR1_13870006 [Rhizophagus clarus]|uniref:Uncharacterized protein n=1 Tax=Rhizophagus clarus TaxID=94130 RepID=A0A2Z6QB59_9GLOM|nr:hypothetical protein RclHR1_13870006 [Rhizophagus clarus]GES92312.1 hypothetical protein GLOIN_2v1883656 [Rhizophagus clarus]